MSNAVVLRLQIPDGQVSLCRRHTGGANATNAGQSDERMRKLPPPRFSCHCERSETVRKVYGLKG